MKRSVIIILFSLSAILAFLPSGCAPGTVTVGVGVGVAGPWAGPYGYPGAGLSGWDDRLERFITTLIPSTR